MKKAESAEMAVEANSVEKKIKKEKKSSKKTKLTSEPDPDDSKSNTPLKKRKEKKRKALEIDGEDNEDERSETSSELGEPMNSMGKKKKKMKFEEEDEDEKEQNPNSLSNFRISVPLREALKSKGIEYLFPIQAMTFDMILDGSDLVGRARTGQGKTLAFVLPILESLTNGPAKASRKTGYGRSPSVLVLLPTRELATQVFADFEVYGGALGLNSCCLAHLTEADEMLRMGFVEDVELILGKVEDASKVQTLLFSATLPDWVKHISAKFLKPDKKTADLVGNEKMKASTNVRHIVLPCSVSARTQLIPDIIRCYSSGGRTIIFTETKDSASTLAGVLPGARALHGDIQQATRECEPPRDVEAYIHRSGRTGRAGKTGVAVMLYDPRKSNFSKIERESGVKFEHISAPQPADIAKAAGAEAAEKINEISDSVIPVFKAAAQELLDSSELSPADLLAKALAKAAGYTEIKSRSLLTSMENYVTVLLECGRPIYAPSFAYGVLRRFLPEDKVESVKGLALTADGKGAVFDVAAQDLDTFLAGQENAAGVSLEVVKSLPRLQEREQSRGRFGGGGGGRGGFSDRRRFSGGRGGGGGRGGFNKGPGGGRGRGNNNRKW
ncbi:UNVERIFIED_CONTAM: DEAD-box ATP-dependent RNA helicase 7 [Sesamum radiatum]|uniref:DEAD-box ATP-dependent RNA helicase 7 n=1 Tax=Sesamum radiatum TaxID=300843 RepID=A0AAW2TEA2_SESRA